jgi:hypothetical protein
VLPPRWPAGLAMGRPASPAPFPQTSTASPACLAAPLARCCLNSLAVKAARRQLLQQAGLPGTTCRCAPCTTAASSCSQKNSGHKRFPFCPIPPQRALLRPGKGWLAATLAASALLSQRCCRQRECCCSYGQWGITNRAATGGLPALGSAGWQAARHQRAQPTNGSDKRGKPCLIAWHDHHVIRASFTKHTKPWTAVWSFCGASC